MDLNAALWSRLPFKIVERVLSFLSVPDLCRYRIVCKRWNQLIRTPEFGAQCAINVAKCDASFIVIRSYRISETPESPESPDSPESAESPESPEVPVVPTHRGWCFLDLNTWRGYTVDDDQYNRPELYPGVVGMDGGLVCQHLSASKETVSVAVYNPIAKTLKELPTVPAHCTSKYFPQLKMIVDSVSRSFKIFLINFSFKDREFLEDPSTSQEDRLKVLNDPLVRVYDSTTNEWRSLPNPSCIRRGVNEVSSVMFQGFLYLLLCSSDEQHPLWRYNLSEDAWENVAVRISGKLFNPQLMVAGNRLFLAAWWLEQIVFEFCSISRVCRFEVIEIKVMARERLFTMSSDQVMEAFDIKTGADDPDTCPMISSGFGNSLWFMSTNSRKSMVYDLATRLWRQWPQILGLKNHEDDFFWTGKPMNLILPNTPW